MAGLLVTFLLFFLTVNAIVRSVSARYWEGVVVGLLRVVVLVLGGVLGTMVLFASSADPSVALLAVVTAVVGPLLSFVVLVLVYRRKSGVAARDEEAANRLLMAWLPVAILDGVLVLTAIMVLALTRDS